MLRTRIPPPVYALCTAALMWGVDHQAPSLRWIGTPWNRLGWLLIGLGLAVDLHSIFLFIRTRTTVNPLQPATASHLVVSGIYRISRNPMYLGLVLALSGWAWLLGSPVCLMLAFLFARVLAIVQIAPEEAALRNRFGASYDEYCRRVNRWIGWQSRPSSAGGDI